MGNNVSFQDYAVVPRGTVNLNRKTLYAERGRHEILEKLKNS
jgi:hypothetical protein